MAQQLTLFETPEPPPFRFKLFLGIFPDFEAIHRIRDKQTTLPDQLGLRGYLRPPEILHATVHSFKDYRESPKELIASVKKVCAIALADQVAFEVIFNEVMSFGRGVNTPFVLTSQNANADFRAVHDLLITKLINHGLASQKDFNFKPHVTLLYDRLCVPPQPTTPVGWKVKEIVLILSHLGQTRYERLASWTLSE